MKGEINLLRNELKERGPLKFAGKSYVPLYLALGVLALEAAAFGGLTYYQTTINREINAAEMDEAELDFEMRQTDAALKEAVGYQARLANFKTLLDTHIFWSPVFEELGNYTYKLVSYDTFQGDTQKNRIVVTGTAPTYRDIAKLILGLKKTDKFTDISFQAGGASKGDKAGFGFLLDIGLDPKLLSK